MDVVGPNMTGANLMAYTLMGYGYYAPELLNSMGLFDPLESGVYTLEMQDIDTPFTYSFTFNVSAAVPEPAAAVLAALVGVLATTARRRNG